MKRSLSRLIEIESRLAGRVMSLDINGDFVRAAMVDISRRRVQQVRERRLAESEEN